MKYNHNGLIEEIQRVEKGDTLGAFIKFTPKLGLREVGHRRGNDKVGLFVQYSGSFLAQIDQYRYDENDSISVNQRWQFDRYGNTLKEGSIFYLFSISTDTPTVNKPFTVGIDLVCPPFKNDKMKVTFGNYDESFVLIDSIGFCMVDGVNNKVEKSFLYNEPGAKPISGIIWIYEGKKLFQMFFRNTIEIK
jgi:hypothetical protein